MRASTDSTKQLEVFLADQCEATKAKYAAELENAGAEWGKPLEMRYAESLVYFGLLARQATPIMDGPHVRGSRTKFKRVVPAGSGDGSVTPTPGPAQVMAHPGSANGVSVQPGLF